VDKITNSLDLLLYKRQINAAIKFVEQSVVASTTTNNISTLVKENDSKGEMIFEDLETIYYSFPTNTGDNQYIA
jgi:hypothetical protein